MKSPNIEELCNIIDFKCITDSVDSVDERVESMEREIRRSLKIEAPARTFTMVIRERNDWLDEEVPDHK